MSNAQDNKSLQLEKTEPRKITPQAGEVAKSTELDAQQLDTVAGGIGGGHTPPAGPGG